MITPENPVGLLNIDHLEFTCEKLTTPTAENFSGMGMLKTKQSKNRNSILFEQGQIRFLLTANSESQSHSNKYFKNHGEGVCKISFRVENLEKSLEAALSRGGELVENITFIETKLGNFKKASIKGFGDVLNEFVERPSEIFNPLFEEILIDEEYRPLKTRCSRIDHLTNNVPHGQMDFWVDFYKKLYGFKETRYFDIKGSKTGLFSKVVQSADHNIIIPINEPETENGKSQIQEFLDRHKGPGVQHIALMTPNILSTVPELKERQFKFLSVPQTYYDAIPTRPFKVQEPIELLTQHGILVDGDQEGYLLQLFTQDYIGPLFFEFIQRKNHWGFGEGNFKALFEAIERDQLARGYLK